jgi:hypothetical protein
MEPNSTRVLKFRDNAGGINSGIERADFEPLGLGPQRWTFDFTAESGDELEYYKNGDLYTEMNIRVTQKNPKGEIIRVFEGISFDKGSPNF